MPAGARGLPLSNEELDEHLAAYYEALGMQSSSAYKGKY